MPTQKETKKYKEDFRKQIQENKTLLLGVTGAILMLIFASFGARGDFFRTKRETKPIPENLIRSLTPTPSDEDEKQKQIGECMVTGCSGQVCASEEIATTCDYKEIYSCYQNATCELQADGECGWTMDSELSSCLQSYVGEPSL